MRPQTQYLEPRDCGEPILILQMIKMPEDHGSQGRIPWTSNLSKITCQKCRLSGPTLNLLNQTSQELSGNMWLNQPFRWWAWGTASHKECESLIRERKMTYSLFSECIEIFLSVDLLYTLKS